MEISEWSGVSGKRTSTKNRKRVELIFFISSTGMPMLQRKLFERTSGDVNSLLRL